MRIVIWNCNMKLHCKFTALQSLQPDIAVIPECANGEILNLRAGLLRPRSMVWIGDNENKGLGVFAFGEYSVALDI